MVLGTWKERRRKTRRRKEMGIGKEKVHLQMLEGGEECKGIKQNVCPAGNREDLGHWVKNFSHFLRGTETRWEPEVSRRDTSSFSHAQRLAPENECHAHSTYSTLAKWLRRPVFRNSIHPCSGEWDRRACWAMLSQGLCLMKSSQEEIS